MRAAVDLIQAKPSLQRAAAVVGNEVKTFHPPTSFTHDGSCPLFQLIGSSVTVASSCAAVSALSSKFYFAASHVHGSEEAYGGGGGGGDRGTKE